MEESKATEKQPSIVPYVTPMILFGVMTYLEGQAMQHYVWLYLAKVILVAAALVYFREPLKDIRLDARWIFPATLIGLLVFVQWVWLDKLVPYPHFTMLGERVGFDPEAKIADGTMRILFITARMFGLALVVPIMEEIFWRSFLLRYITEPDFKKLPMGQFSWGAFAIVALLFAAVHPEWLVALIAAVAYGLLIRWSRSLFACIVAHAVTNLALGIYVLTTKEWIYW